MLKKARRAEDTLFPMHKQGGVSRHAKCYRAIYRRARNRVTHQRRKVELCFSKIERDVIAHGVFTSVT